MQKDSGGQSPIWPVMFPEETLVIKRPCLRHICQGNTDVGELLSYLLYEAGKEACKHGIDPKAAAVVVLYRFHDDILYCLDYSTAENALIRNIKKLVQLGFIEAQPRYQRFTIYLEKIREAIAQYIQTQRRRPPQHRYWYGRSEIYLPSEDSLSYKKYEETKVEEPEILIPFYIED